MTSEIIAHDIVAPAYDRSAARAYVRQGDENAITYMVSRAKKYDIVETEQEGEMIAALLRLASEKGITQE